MKPLLYKEKGFTLIELMLVTSILAFVFVGMISLFIYTSVQAQLAGNKTLAVAQAQDKIEEIRQTAYNSITTNFGSGGTPGNTFDVSLTDGKGAVYVNSTNAELLVIKTVVCWRDKYNRLIGEDADLDGVLDGGEDQNGNNELDSPVTLISMITRR